MTLQIIHIIKLSIDLLSSCLYLSFNGLVIQRCETNKIFPIRNLIFELFGPCAQLINKIKGPKSTRTLVKSHFYQGFKFRTQMLLKYLDTHRLPTNISHKSQDLNPKSITTAVTNNIYTRRINIIE